MKVMTIIGTRPEIIRLSETIKLLDRYTDHILVHTGQNYDYELNEIFFKELSLRKPDYYLNVKATSIGEQLGNILISSEKVFLKEKPDALLILGDTNSALSCIIAKRMKVPTFHMEAGNRCFDENVPEEINRRIIDHTCDVNLPYTLHAKLNLLNEGIHPKRIFITGSPIREVLEKNMKMIDQSSILTELKLIPNEYFVVSAHREENIASEKVFNEFIDLLNLLAKKYEKKIIVTTHPRTRKRIEQTNINLNEHIVLHKPFGFFDYVYLQKNAFCNISDSGTINEDASILQIPSVVIRYSTERPEALDNGNIILSGMNPDDVLRSIAVITDQKERNIKFSSPNDYSDINVSEKVVRIIIGQTHMLKKQIWG
jgi:UDP-N-acetyl-L-fucosamine synthase